MHTSIVKVQGLSHKYGSQLAINNINFELQKAGIYCLLGSNGAGKSTIMNILCGVLKQTRGEVFIRDISLSKKPLEAKKFIGYLPQKPPVLPDLTIEEYLRHSAKIRLMKSGTIEGAIDEVMGKVGIGHFRKRLIKNLSGGFQQRVGIAQAIIHKPDLVVFDEPTNGLDPNQILEMRKLIREIAEERTVILSTHILQEVQALCDYIWMVNGGKMVFSGTMLDFDNYLRPNSLVISLLKPPALESLSLLEGVDHAEEISANRFRILFSNALTASESIAEYSSKNAWQLTELNLEKTSLDDIFAALSAAQKSTAS